MKKENEEFVLSVLSEKRFNDGGSAHAVDDEHDVVADKNGGDEELGVVVETVDYPRNESTSFPLDLGTDTVTGDEGDFGAREEGAENECYDGED